MSHRTILKAKSDRSRETVPVVEAILSEPELGSHTPVRWTCHHHMDGSEITGYVMASGGLETIAQTRQGDGIDARANAELIVQAVNNHDYYAPVIHDLVAALELCLKCEGLTWATEQEADRALARAKRVVGI